MLYDYSIVPLTAHALSARVNDIIRDVQNGAYTMPLFSVNLVPEGQPVWDKVGDMAAIYADYRDRLAAAGVQSGILVQASLGHGYPLTKAPFQNIIAVSDGEPIHAYCPLDPDFLAHFSDVMRRLAALRPRVIMLDDDFRLMVRPAKGCVCPRHVAAFNAAAGVSFSKDQLRAHLLTHKKTDPLCRIFAQTQRDALVGAARAFRAAVDSQDPTIQGVNCTSGDLCEAVDATSKVFAGAGNPTVVRLPNGSYAPASAHGFSHAMRMTAVCASKLRKSGVDVLLAETDTVPFNRYGKSARYLHAHYTACILDGLSGAKHWLTRMTSYEPQSGKAYREILAKHRGLYTKLQTLAKDLRFVGAASLFTEQTDFDFSATWVWDSHPNCFVTKNLERMGIPFYFTDGAAPALFAEEHILDDLSDDEVNALFDGSVLLDGAAAKGLFDRSFTESIGVEVRDWDGGKVSAESFDQNGYTCCTKQKGFHKLTPLGRTQTLSHNIRREDGVAVKLAPAVTVLPRENGTFTAVFCGSPDAEFVYHEGFSFLNETRKAQLVDLLSRAGALPVYLVGDDEVCLRAGYTADGRLLAACFPLGFDPVETPRLYLQTPPAQVVVLDENGNERDVAFTDEGDGTYALDYRLEPMYPAVFLIKNSVATKRNL